MKKASAEMSANRPLRATNLQVGAQAASTSVAGRATTPVKEATLRRVQGRVSRCRAVRRGSGGPIGARDGIATLVVVSWRYGRGGIKHERKRNGGRTAARGARKNWSFAQKYRATSQNQKLSLLRPARYTILVMFNI